MAAAAAPTVFTRENLPPVLATQMFVNNVFLNGKNAVTFPVVDPATEKVIADVTDCNASEDVDTAVTAAVAAFQRGSSYRQMSGGDRAALLTRLADLLEEEATYVAALESLDVGKPKKYCVYDVASAVKTLRFYGGVAASGLGGATIPLNGHFVHTDVEPLGVVAAILPFNFALCGIISKLAPAVAAGCTIIFKPSELAPLMALYVCSLTVRAGWPPGVVGALPGYAATGAALVAHPRVKKVSFTGSNKVGKLILQSCAERMVRCSIEAGGKNPVIVCDDADVKDAVRIACNGNFYHSGQICSAISRVYVPTAMVGDFVDLAVKNAQARVVGDQFHEDTQMGPLVSKVQADKVMRYIEVAVGEGATVHCGGKRWGSTGFWVEPTVITGLREDSVVVREEIFGPVMIILTYESLEDVIERANNTNFGLAASIVTPSLERSMYLSKALDVGTVWVNTHGVFDPSVSYGGHKESGIGLENGLEGVHEYCQSKSCIVALSV